jgi:hypothetical protein
MANGEQVTVGREFAAEAMPPAYRDCVARVRAAHDEGDHRFEGVGRFRHLCLADGTTYFPEVWAKDRPASMAAIFFALLAFGTTLWGITTLRGSLGLPLLGGALVSAVLSVVFWRRYNKKEAARRESVDDGTYLSSEGLLLLWRGECCIYPRAAIRGFEKKFHEDVVSWIYVTFERDGNELTERLVPGGDDLLTLFQEWLESAARLEDEAEDQGTEQSGT